MVIFHSYVSLPEGRLNEKSDVILEGNGLKWSQHLKNTMGNSCGRQIQLNPNVSG